MLFFRLFFIFSLFFILSSKSLWAGIVATKPAARKIVIHLPQEPTSLDWTLANRRIDQLVINNLQEGLIEIGPHHQVIPVLTKSWERSGDGKTYTFHLRQDVTWSDGKPLIAQHFVDGWKRLISPITDTPNGYFLMSVIGAEKYKKGREPEFSTVGMKAIDNYTIELKLSKPQWNWIWNFAQPATYPIRQDLIDLHGAKFWTAPGNLVTLGPYLLVSHDYDSSFVLKKNPHYIAPNAQIRIGNIDELDFKIVPSGEVTAAFLSQKLDLVCYVANPGEIPASAKPFLRWSEPNTTKRIDFNAKRFPVSNRDIRKAIALSIDRRKFAQMIGPEATAGSSASPMSMITHFKNMGVHYDLTKARKLVRSSDVDNFSVEILVPMFDEHSSEDLKSAQQIQSILEHDLHATVILQQATTEQQYSLLRDTGEYSLLIRDWTGTHDPDEFYAFYASFSQKSTNWSNPEYDKLIEQARTEKSDTQRMDLYKKMDEMLVEKEFVIVPLFYSSDGMLVSSRVLGFDPQRPDPCRVRSLNIR